MAQYKIPQDVEAEDKLIGPFSFRQFLYLIVAALGIAIGVGLFQIFPGLIIIPFPIVILFLALALPIRKDQPMETYLTAVIRFFLKPRKRLWQPEGSIDLVTIVAPQVAAVPFTKSVGGAAAAAQLGYLAQVIDTQGWSTRGVISPNASISDTTYAEAQQAEDVLDENTEISRTFDSMIGKSDTSYRQSVVEKFREAARMPRGQTSTPTAPTPTPQPTPLASQPQSSAPIPLVAADLSSNDDATDDATNVDYDPYPRMHQRVVQPATDPFAVLPAAEPTTSATQMAGSQNTPSGEPVSPDIMRLANNNDLSISAIANEAHRIRNKDNEEVVINLH